MNIKNKIEKCEGLNCSFEGVLANKFHKLCRECNNERLHGSKFGKQYKNTLSSKKSLNKLKNSQKQSIKRLSYRLDNKKEKLSHKVKEPDRLSMIQKDEIFYEKCFNNSNHKCEECGEDLPAIFRDEDGNVVARWRYSHIIPKSIAPKLRHNINNINHLCLKHHNQWENGDKESMNIYKGNLELFPSFLKYKKFASEN